MYKFIRGNKRFIPAIVSCVALVVAFGISTLSSVGSSENTKTTQLAAAQRGADQTANRGSARSLETTTTTAAPTTTVPPTTTTVAPTTTTTAKPKPKPTTTTAKPKPVVADSGPIGDDVWRKLANCEAGGRNDLGAPYYGYFQFSAATWKAMGGTGLPSDHTYDEQKALAIKLQARSGWGQWPVCSKKIGVL